MRITGFHVDGFGLLHDQAVEDVPAGTTVVLGPNEAGKSTLHAFLVRTLFGHPRANDAVGRNRHEPLRGGRHGGVVHCADEAGAWEVHRHTEGTPRLRVVAPDGSESAGNDAVLDLLGRTVDESRYEQVFAIDLDDLAGVGSLGDGALDDLLFDAATVGTGRSLRAARDEALGRRDELWTPTSTKRPLAAAIRRRADARTALAAAQDAARHNLDVRRRLDAAAARVQELADEQGATAGRIALLERVCDAWASWSRVSELEGRLAELPDVTVDVARVEAARGAERDLEVAEERLTSLREERDRLAADAAGIELDDAALDVADRVESLADALGAHDLAVEQLGGALQALDEAERAAAVALADLDDGWDAERVRSVTVDAPTRQGLEAAGDALLDAELRAEAATERADEAARAAARRQRALDEHASAVPDAPDEDELSTAEQAVAVLRAGVPSLERIEATDPGGAVSRASPVSARTAAALVVVATLLGVAAVAGFVPDAVPAWLVALLATGLVAVSAYAVGRARRSAGGALPGAGTGGVGDGGLAADVARAARTLGLRDRPSLAEVEQAAGRVASARDRRRTATDAERHLAGLRSEVQDADGRATELAEVARRRRQECAEAAAAWQQACDRAGLDGDEGVRVTLTRHDRVTVARRALDDLDAARRDVERARPRVEGYRADATEVATALGHDATGQAAVRLLPGLRERVRAAREDRAEHHRRGERLAALDSGPAEAAADRARAARDQALGAEGAEDLGDLEHRAATAAERAAIQEDLARARRAVDQLLGTGPRGEDGRTLLRTADPTAWEGELASAREAAAALTEERDLALAERTELEAELRRLGGDDAVPRAAQELAAAEDEVAELAERWAVADTAARLLEETVARFEREQQPRVLTRASELFERATGGHWAQVRRFDGQVVVARSEGGDPVPATVLSRGTREQLWLCLRLALAEDLSRDRPLPLLVDDLLGTSDPERSLHVARVLAEVARHQQVWLFTCHPRTADLVTSTDPSAGVLRLRRGGRVAGLARREVEPDEEFVLQLDV